MKSHYYILAAVAFFGMGGALLGLGAGLLQSNPDTVAKDGLGLGISAMGIAMGVVAFIALLAGIYKFDKEGW